VLKDKLKSRKFWITIGSAIATIAIGFGLDVSPEVIVGAISGIGAIYIFIQGLIDKEDKKIK